MSEQTEQKDVPSEEQQQQQQQQEDQKQQENAAATEKDEAKENGTGGGGDAATEPVAEPPKDMRAVVLSGFGGFKTVKILKKPEPTLNEGEVLIRVKAW